MSDNGNNLRDENGALIGGLDVLEYNAGIEDFRLGAAPPDLTTPSYDLGRQRAASDKSRKDDVEGWFERDTQERLARMKEILPAEAYAELEQKFAEIERDRRASVKQRRRE